MKWWDSERKQSAGETRMEEEWMGTLQHFLFILIFFLSDNGIRYSNLYEYILLLVMLMHTQHMMSVTF